MGARRIFLALDLDERVASRRCLPTAPTDEQVAEMRRSLWLAAHPRMGDALGLRLATTGLDDTAFLSLLGESLSSLKRRCIRPNWIDRAVAITSIAEPYPLPNVARRPTVRAAAASLLAPFLRQAGDLLRSRLVARGLATFLSRDLEEQLLRELSNQLAFTLERVLVLEVNVSRERGRLAGITPEERFSAFLNGIDSQRGRLRVLCQYPVLWRRLTTASEDWASATAELVERLHDDRSVLQETLFEGQLLGSPVRIVTHQGDFHCGRRSVSFVEFDSGKRVVYKPRNLAVDEHFQGWLHWLNSHSSRFGFRLLRIARRPAWGWVEFVEHRPCSHRAEVQAFYRRLGGLLASLYMLDGVDCHYENLIAAGDQPILVDLESIFHGTAHRVPGRESRTDMDTVMRTSLLPRHTTVGQRIVDVGGLSGNAADIEEPVRRWLDSGRDTMRLGYVPARFPRSVNRPMLGDELVDPYQYRYELEQGFREVCQVVRASQSDLLLDGGPVDRFSDDPVRVILRPTRSYALLLDRANHPEALGDGLYQSLAFDHLWLDAAEWRSGAEIVLAEQKDLRAGDVPRFTSVPSSRTVWTSDGRVLPETLNEPSMDSVRRRIRCLDEKDIERQVSYIRTSMAALSGPSPEGVTASRPIGTSDREPSEFELLAAAAQVARRLTDLAFWAGDEVQWLGLEYRDGGWTLGPVGLDLYGGLPGIALFLLRAGQVLETQEWSDLGRTVLTQSITGAVRSEPAWQSSCCGAFSGPGGVLYASAHGAAVIGQEQCQALVAPIALRMESCVSRDSIFDIIAGSAGGIMVFLALHDALGCEQYLQAATACGERLLATARDIGNGRAWDCLRGTTPSGGYSHGVAGIASALLSLYHIRPDRRFLEAAMQALAYQESLFLPDHRVWRDVRLDCLDKPPERLTQAWCHGAPGIGLAYIRALSNVDRDVSGCIEGGIHSALRVTRSKGFGGTHCLCHGDLGNSELLLQSAAVLGDPRLLVEARQVAGRVIDEAASAGWSCGFGAGAETPGLMTGLAGIGYQFLRLAKPSEVPSVLTLDPPSVPRSEHVSP